MNTPTMNPIQSSSISEIGHDGEHMFVRFVPSKGATKGKLYRYVAVPTYVWLAVSEEINAGGSAGKIVNSRIVKGGYSYELVYEDELPLAGSCTYPNCKCIVQTSTSEPKPKCPVYP